MASYQGDLKTRQSDEQHYAWLAFNKFFGREPTDPELAQATAAYRSGDANRPNVQGGDAFVAQMFQNENNTPDKMYAREQEELLKKAPEKYGDVDAIYQELYKRGASQGELDHFGKMLASGEVDPYELRQFVMAQPEYQAGEDKKFRGELAEELGGYEQDVFDKEKENVISRFAKAGRLNSSSLDYALTDLMGKISQERSKYLATVSANQYEGNKDAAREDYRIGLERMFGREDYGRTRADQLEDMLTKRSWEIGDYATEAEAYERAMRNARGGGGMGKGIGALAGGAIGSFWGPAGAQAGMGVGGAGGGLFDYYNQ